MPHSTVDKSKTLNEIPDEILDPVIREVAQSPMTRALVAVLGKLSDRDRRKIRAALPGAPERPPKRVGDSVKCVRDIRAIPPERYRLESDGRKWKRVAQDRRTLAIQLATYADPDGTSITAGTKRLAAELGWSLRTLARRLDDLKKLDLLFNEGLTGEHGTARREIDIHNLKAGMPDRKAEMPDSSESERDCQIESRKQEKQDCQISGSRNAK